MDQQVTERAGGKKAQIGPDCTCPDCDARLAEKKDKSLHCTTCGWDERSPR